MTDTTSDDATTESRKESHGESHASMSDQKSRRKSRVDRSEAKPQVRKSRGSDGKSRALLPRKVTFSAPSYKGAERDPRGEGDQQNPPRGGEPEPVGPLAEQFLTDLAARQAEARNRLARAHQRRPR